MKMMSKSEDSEQWTAQLYHVHNWCLYIDAWKEAYVLNLFVGKMRNVLNLFVGLKTPFYAHLTSFVMIYWFLAKL